MLDKSLMNLFIIIFIIFGGPIFGQENEFKLMGNDYKRVDGKWYTYHENKIGDELNPNILIVRLKDKIDLNEHLLEKIINKGVNIKSSKLLGGFYILKIDESLNPFVTAKYLSEFELFDVIEFDAYGKFESSPSDSLYTNQWNLVKIGMPSAWDITTGRSNIIIGILDNGVTYTHEDLDGNIWVNPDEDINDNGIPDFYPVGSGGDLDSVDNDSNGYIDDLIGWNFHDNNNTLNSDRTHGTCVAGIAAAQTNNYENNNYIGIAGISGGWGFINGASIMPVKLGYIYPTTSYTLQAINYATKMKANVINLSIGFSYTHTGIANAIDIAANDSNIIVIAASGNESSYVTFPANDINTIAVGAVDSNDVRRSTSGYGSTLDIVAPDGIPSTSMLGYATEIHGTSFAAPEVSGLVALILTINENLSWQEVRTIICESADKVAGMNGSNFTNYYGYGRINAHEALKYTLENYGGTLIQDINVASGDTLHFQSNSTINLNSYSIKSTGGVIQVDEAASITPDIRLMSGTNIIGLYSTIDSAFSNGSVVEVRDTYSSSVDLIVPSGKTLKPQLGSVLEFAPEKHMYVNGTLSANGGTFTGISSTWSGIEYQSGSDGMLYNCTISNSSYGVQITSSNPLIQNNTITNCGDRGLSVYSASPRILSNSIIDSRVYLNNCDSEFSNNYITGETNVGYPPYCSVYLYNSQPFFMYNTIDIEDEFSIVTYTSSMEFGLSGESPPDCGGYNVLDNDPLNDGIVHATNYSDIYFGIGDDQELYDYGYNSILGGSCPLWTDGTSYIDAQWCYWEDGDPAPSCYGNVETDYELDEDPDGGSSLAKSISSLESLSENQITLEDSLFSDVFQMMHNKEFESALTSLENIIKDYEDTRYAYRAINLALKLKRNQEVTDNEEWLDKISKLVSNDDLLGMIDLKKVSNYQKKGEIDKAIALSEKIPDIRKNKEYEVASLFNLFNFYHKDKDNLEMAKLYLDELKENYPDNDLTYIARMDMGEEITYVKLEKESSSETISEEEEMVIPENYALNAAYPNPFNPNTIIEFALPVQSNVKCSIFDLRGNLVKEYSYEQNAGTYSIVWNASNVSSGIYLIRFVAEASDGSETFVDYQKVTLLK